MKKVPCVRPVRLQAWGNDDYTMGIFCSKTGLIDYARKCIKFFRTDGYKKQLFEKGIRDADNFTFDDIAFEIYELRLAGRHGAEAFDKFVERNSNIKVVSQMRKAILGASDWETDEQKNERGI